MCKANPPIIPPGFRRTACLWTGLILLGVICLSWTPFALILLNLPVTEHRKQFGKTVIRQGFRIYLTILAKFGWLKLAIETWDDAALKTPSIIAPNHPGLLDAVILLAQIPNCTCILKSSLLNHPLFGPGARLAGYISNESTHGMIREAVKALEAGQHILMFPEGTRTERLPISPLKISPFLIAHKANAPIQTVLIHNPSGFLGKKKPFWMAPDLPVPMRIRMGLIFPPENNVRLLAQAVENYFTREL